MYIIWYCKYELKHQDFYVCQRHPSIVGVGRLTTNLLHINVVMYLVKNSTNLEMVSHYVCNLTLGEKFLAEEHLGTDVENEAIIFTKAVVNGKILYSSNYRKVVK